MLMATLGRKLEETHAVTFSHIVTAVTCVKDNQNKKRRKGVCFLFV